MPAAAVIPAPVAYIKVVAVKKLVVGFLADRCMVRSPQGSVYRRAFAILPESCAYRLARKGAAIWFFYFEKIRVFQASICLNTLAWNNNIGLLFYFVGF